MPRRDPLGDRIKGYEAREGDRRAMRGVPLVVRVDGRSFSTFTAGMARPFDADLAELMTLTAAYLLEEVDGARVAYTQSDEISLVLDPFGTPSADEVLRHLEARLADAGDDEPVPADLHDPEGPHPDDVVPAHVSRERLARLIGEIRRGAAPPEAVIQFMFDGRILKLATVVAGLATARFLQGALALWPDRCARQLPVFDARMFEVPSRSEAVAALAWREIDAMRNAVSMAARARFRPEEMHGRSSVQMKAMLLGAGIDFEAYPARFRRGVYLRRERVVRDLDPAVLARIPQARRPAGPVTRRETVRLDLPPTWHLANAVEVLLDGAAPVLRDARDAA